MAKKKKKLDSIVRKADLDSLVGWKPQHLSLARVEELRKKFFGREQSGTYSDYFGKYPSELPEESEATETALVKSRAEIVAMHRVDSLEQLRRRAGMDKYRNELVKAIADNISFDDGLEKVLQYINANAQDRLKELGIKTAKTLQDIAKVMPEISSAEIAWISTINGVPNIYLIRGNGVPTILDFNVDGIEFGFDGLNSFELQRDFSYDPYEAAGFTGATRGAMFHKFTPQFAKAFRTLAFLALSDSMIYTKLYNEHRSNALIIGDGKLKRKLIEKNAQGYGMSLGQIAYSKLEDLPIGREEFAKLEDRIKDLLSRKQLYDLGRDLMCSPMNLVTIAGLLEKVPKTLLSDEKFVGYILPFGKGIKFLDQAGNEVEYVPYEPFLQIDAQQNLHHIASDISRGNQLLSWIFDSYAEDVEARFAKHRELPLDRLREEFRIRYGTIVPTRAVKSISQVASFLDVGTLKGGDTSFNYSLKVGLLEGRVLLELLDKLPKGLVPEIRTIRREYVNTDSIEMLIGRVFKFGQYFSADKKIVLYSPEDRTFKDFSAVEKQTYYDTHVHELGHGIWKNLTEERRNRWKAISRADATTLDEEVKRAFVHDIEQLRNIYGGSFLVIPEELQEKEQEIPESRKQVWVEEDFCEHFAAYINHGFEFRKLAAKSRDLQEKYQFLRKLFEDKAREDESIEYESMPLMTLSDIAKYRGHLMQRRSLEEALKEQQRRLQRREEGSREIRESVIPSYEVITGTAGDMELQRHIYGQRDPVNTYILRELSNYLPPTIDVREVDHIRLKTLLRTNVRKATAYLTKEFPELDRDITLDFLRDVREGILSVRQQRENKLY